jgi:ubiquinone/menaquinone biosynthesis C-methylase UbiE
MASSVDLYGTAYGNFASAALEQARRETYGEDFGQSSWVTGDEYRRFFRLLDLKPTDRVLDVGCGSGGPAVFLASAIGCEVTGVDVNEAGIRAGRDLANKARLAEKVHFHPVDARQKLPFPDQSFDAIVCMDVICHLPNRGQMFLDWHRVLRSGGRMLYTDPIVVTGLVSKEEFAVRSSTGYFEFAPPGVNEQLIREASFELVLTEDVTENEAAISEHWHDAREKHTQELISLEGKDTFEGLQRFLQTVHKLTRERRLSRFVYLALKSNN